METDTLPVDQKPRLVPYHLQKSIKDWLDRGVKEEIFEKVPDGEATTWCSPAVAQPKPEIIEKKTEELDFIYRLHVCKILTKLDPRQGYHQLALDSSTKQVATFRTAWGSYRHQRLVFGAKLSQDVFDEALFRIFGAIHHCLNQRDDTFLGESDQSKGRQRVWGA